MTSWKQKALTYLDQDGLFAPSPFPKTKWEGGNMIKDLGIFIIMLGKLGELEHQDVDRFNSSIRACYEETGLLNRNPGRHDQQAHDDYIGAVTASAYCDQEVAKEIAFNNKIYRDNLKDGKIYFGGFFGRFVHLRPLFKLCANGRLNWFDKLILWGYFSIPSSKDESNLILKWITAQACKRFQVLQGTVDKFLKSKNWLEIFSNYYGKEHVFSEYFHE